jgi:hypothetical protein
MKNQPMLRMQRRKRDSVKASTMRFSQAAAFLVVLPLFGALPSHLSAQEASGYRALASVEHETRRRLSTVRLLAPEGREG